MARTAAAAGVEFRYGQEATRIVTDADGAVRGVVTSGGETLPADAVVCTIDLPTAYEWLLPGLRPEKLREKLSRRLPGKTGAAKFYGERVHKLYGLVIRCSNTLSPKHGRVPLTFFPWASISGELPPGHHILRAYNCGWRLLFPALRPPPSIWHGGNRRPG